MSEDMPNGGAGSVPMKPQNEGGANHTICFTGGCEALFAEEGSIWPVDKPLRWTSFDVVNKLKFEIRRQTGLKKFKIGHAGTLDPLADGLLTKGFFLKGTQIWKEKNFI